jgi:hypothetical protein
MNGWNHKDTRVIRTNHIEQVVATGIQRKADALLLRGTALQSEMGVIQINSGAFASKGKGVSLQVIVGDIDCTLFSIRVSPGLGAPGKPFGSDQS